MADSFKKNHLSISQFSEPLNYVYPLPPQGPKFKIKKKNRAEHGKNIQNKLNSLNAYFGDGVPIVDDELIQEEVIYVEFVSDWGYGLNFEQFDDTVKLRYQLRNVRKEQKAYSDLERFSATIMFNKDGVSHFIKRIDKYLTKNTRYQGKETNNPVANSLFGNVEDLKIATLEAFWSDAQHYEFPKKGEDVWWEVWFKKTDDGQNKLANNLAVVGAKLGSSTLEFSDISIRLIKGTSEQLSKSLLLLDTLMEIRRPQEMNDFITAPDVSYESKKEWMDDLVQRTKVQLNDNSVLICLLDTGLNNNHPFLNKIVPDDQLYTYNESWGVDDSEPHGGHGTPMSGIALYGDLTDALATSGEIKIYHGVESFKVKHPKEQNDKTLFGTIYKTAVSTPILDRRNPRVYCLTVTNDGFAFRGRPSAHSAALDAIAFGDKSGGELIFVSGGTLNYNKHTDYPNQNFLGSVKDPAQAYNAVTVGSYTQLDKLVSGNDSCIVPFGGMSANNATSAIWETQWPNKPDIVLEGGNLATDGTNLWHREELKPLSIDKEYPRHIFLPFDGTCSATAFAAKMAAELRTMYPDYWPETIRGLMVHSADWTEEMLSTVDFQNEGQRKALLRSVGYGVPNLEKAMESANNSLTLVSQQTMKPYQLDGATIVYNEFNFYKIPWPKNILENDLYDKNVKVTVTLSYFIEPNPGERRYASSFSYHSHELDFKLIRKDESLNDFKRRVSKDSPNFSGRANFKGEDWSIKRVRSKGSIKKDFLDTNGADLATRRYLAVYPKNGWYKSRKVLKKYDKSVRYSLIVSIETPVTNVDIYTPVENLIKIALEV